MDGENFMENPMNKWMIWGYHYFWKHPHAGFVFLFGGCWSLLVDFVVECVVFYCWLVTCMYCWAMLFWWEYLFQTPNKQNCSENNWAMKKTWLFMIYSLCIFIKPLWGSLLNHQYNGKATGVWSPNEKVDLLLVLFLLVCQDDIDAMEEIPKKKCHQGCHVLNAYMSYNFEVCQ